MIVSSILVLPPLPVLPIDRALVVLPIDMIEFVLATLLILALLPLLPIALALLVLPLALYVVVSPLAGFGPFVPNGVFGGGGYAATPCSLSADGGAVQKRPRSGGGGDDAFAGPGEVPRLKCR